MTKYVIIVAGGSGTRMNSVVPKQFLLLNGKPILYYTIQSFFKAYADFNVILVLPEDHVSAGQEIIDAFFGYEKIKICTGGRTRFHSVQNGLNLIEEDGIIFVQDAVRCLTSPQLIRDCFAAVLEYGNAVPVVPVKDSVRILNQGGNESIDRQLVKLVQTPQAFYSKILLPAFQIDYKEQFTDEATVVEAYGLKIHLVDGDPNNLKITVPADLLLAEKIVEQLKALGED